ncbi:MAG: recombination protein RecR [Leptospiraceae bacterium]|nr:recombination protein RecR [Leptospiraceae bacterium]
MIPELERVVEQIAALPGIGRKSATRIAFHFLKQNQEKVEDFLTSVTQFHSKVEYCDECGALKSRHLHCSMCTPGQRNETLLCVVEQPSDIFAIEASGEYNGLYHVLMGALSPLDGIGPDDLRLASLPARVQKHPALQEIIIATNPSIEGNTTANYILSMMAEFKNLKFSRIASGLALGSQIEYADARIISQSLRARTVLE